LETWKRRNVRLAYEWDVNNYEEAESDKPEFYGTRKKLVHKLTLRNIICLLFKWLL